MEEKPKFGLAESDQSDNFFDEKNTLIAGYEPNHKPMSEQIRSRVASFMVTYDQLQEIANTIIDLHESMQNPEYWKAFKRNFSPDRDKRQTELHHAAVNCFMSLEAMERAKNTD